MPAASVISPEEKEEILQLVAKTKAESPKTTNREIAKQVGRSRASVSKISRDDHFEAYKAHFKQKIDKKRFKAIQEVDERIMNKVSSGRVKTYQLVGISKTFYEQSFGLAEKQGQINNDVKVGVQIVREAPYSEVTDTNEPE